jgi:predicted amidohydrolase
MARFVGVSSISFSTGTGEDLQKMQKAMALWENYINTAALDKPDIILLPEIFLQNTGNSASKEESAAKSDYLPEGGEITKFVSRKAKEHKTYIFASYWRKGEKSGKYNSAVLFDRDGQVAGVYDKTFPTIGEIEDGTIPGEGAKIFQTDFGRVGAIICFDLNFHELLADYKSKGVELLCMLSAFRGGFMVPAAAFKNQMFMATSTPGENSVIVDPLGRVLAESSAYGRVIFAKINLDSKIVHIDYNQQRVADMKKKYKEHVMIAVASPEGVYFISSLHPEISIQDMIKEFEIETLDEYLARARRERLKYINS